MGLVQKAKLTVPLNNLASLADMRLRTHLNRPPGRIQRKVAICCYSSEN